MYQQDFHHHLEKDKDQEKNKMMMKKKKLMKRELILNAKHQEDGLKDLKLMLKLPLMDRHF